MVEQAVDDQAIADARHAHRSVADDDLAPAPEHQPVARRGVELERDQPAPLLLDQIDPVAGTEGDAADGADAVDRGGPGRLEPVTPSQRKRATSVASSPATSTLSPATASATGDRGAGSRWTSRNDRSSTTTASLPRRIPTRNPELAISFNA